MMNHNCENNKLWKLCANMGFIMSQVASTLKKRKERFY